MGYFVIAAVLWSALVVSVVLTVIAYWRRSWKLLWVSATLGLVFSFAAAFSVGPFTLMLVSIQIASAVAFRWSASWLGWTALISTAGLIWFLVVPFQLFIRTFPPFSLLLPLGFLAALIATLISPPAARTQTPDHPPA